MLEAFAADVVFHIASAGKFFLLANVAQKFMEEFRAERLDLDLVLQAAHEGVFGEIAEREVGAEDDYEFERNFKSGAGPERKNVFAAIEGNDPAVQKLAGCDALAAEVVNQQDPVVGLHLQGRGTHAGNLVHAGIQHVGAHFAADFHHGGGITPSADLRLLLRYRWCGE